MKIQGGFNQQQLDVVAGVFSREENNYHDQVHVIQANLG